MMQQLLSTVVLVEAVLIFLTLFNSNIRELLLQAFDEFKQGKGILILRSIAVICLAFFFSSVYTSLQIRRRLMLAGTSDLSDQLLLSDKILQTFLTGMMLLLGVVIDQLHLLIREESSLKNILKSENAQIEKKKLQIDMQLGVFTNEIDKLSSKITLLELDHKTKTEKALAAGMTASTLKKQAEELYIEYDHLLDYNQTLRNQLQSIDEILLKDNETPASSVGEFGLDNELVKSSRCDQVVFSGISPVTSPRHRRPIYQH